MPALERRGAPGARGRAGWAPVRRCAAGHTPEPRIGPAPVIRTPLGWGLAPPSGASRERLSFNRRRHLGPRHRRCPCRRHRRPPHPRPPLPVWLTAQRVCVLCHPHCHLLHPPFLCAPFPHIRLPVPLHLHTHLRGNALPATRKQEPPPAPEAGRGGRAAVAPRQRRPHRRSGARGGPRGGGSVAVEAAAVRVDAPK